MLKKYGIWFILAQVFILLLDLIVYHSFSLLGYINISFVIGAILVLFSLTGYVINKGFFDVIFASFQHIFSRMSDTERRKLSELIPLQYHLPFITGILILAVMLFTLILYYL